MQTLTLMVRLQFKQAMHGFLLHALADGSGHTQLGQRTTPVAQAQAAKRLNGDR